MGIKIEYFVHGTTTDNATGKSSGWSQVQLTELGKEQAINLGKANKDLYMDIIFTSDLDRAVNSAKLAFSNIKRVQDVRLRECHYGDLDGEDKSKVIYEDHINIPFPNGESLLDVEKRIKEFIDFLKENYDNKTIGIVAHKATQMAFEVLTKGITWEEVIENDWRKTGAWQPGWEYWIE